MSERLTRQQIARGLDEGFTAKDAKTLGVMLNPQEPETRVVFRTWKDDGSVLALMPDETFDSSGHCTSYMHVGQHSAADYQGCIAATRPATPEEYAPLRAELEQIGYRVRPIARYVRRRTV